MTVFRKKYDHVCSLGQWCAVAIDLRKLGLRSHSGPFDWIGQYVPVSQYLDMTANGVQGLMLKDNLRDVGSNEAEGTLHNLTYSPLLDDFNRFDDPENREEYYPFDEQNEEFTLPLPWMIDR